MPSRYLIAPFISGFCFTLGYLITHRIFSFQEIVAIPLLETFERGEFPGKSLEDLRRERGELLADLRVDVAYMSSKLTRSEKRRKKKEYIRLEEFRRENELDNALETLTPLWKLQDAAPYIREDLSRIPEKEPVLMSPNFRFPFPLLDLSSQEPQ